MRLAARFAASRCGGAIILAILSLLLAPTAASAIETYSSSHLNQLIAKAIVPDRNNEQLYFSVISGAFWTPEVQRYAASDGVFYQFTGTAELGIDGRTMTLQPGDGVFVQAGSKFTLKSLDANHSPTYLRFLLSPSPGSEAADEADGTSVELYRSPTPVPGLMHERNVLSLTRVPVPPQALPDLLHRRTGAALHYVISGVGAEFGDGKTMVRGPGSVSYQPAGFSYQWGNPGLKPLIYLVFNVSPKDLDPIIVEDQQPEDPFARDPHLTVAIYCVGISMFLTVMVMSGTISDYHRDRRSRRLDRDDDRRC
jgi:mannose-6-phosphate isomerase-like protein (cupin superfamily)